MEVVDTRPIKKKCYKNSYHVAAQQLLCDQRINISQRHILYLRGTSIISSEDFYYMFACLFPNAFM